MSSSLVRYRSSYTAGIPSCHASHDAREDLPTPNAKLLVVTGAAIFGVNEQALAQSSVKIGYALSRTGPNAGGAAVTTLPNYKLWVKDARNSFILRPSGG